MCWRGGEEQKQNRPNTQSTRVGKGDEARFAPVPWYQPLRELGGLPHQFKGTSLEREPEAKVKEASLAYLDFLRKEAYSQDSFKRAAELGTKLLEAAHGWEEACRTIRRCWIETQGDHFQQLHSNFFEGLVDEELLAHARANALEGVEAHSTHAGTERVRCTPHPSLRDHLEEVVERCKQRTGVALLRQRR